MILPPVDEDADDEEERKDPAINAAFQVNTLSYTVNPFNIVLSHIK